MADLNDLYGRGFEYPFAFSDTAGGVEEAEDVNSVRASLMRLLDTAPGEQFMHPTYGCAIKTLQFEQDTDVFRALAVTAIRDAVALNEPRIAEVVGVELEPTSDANPHTIKISVYFRLINSQRVDNFVYPFFTGEVT